MTAPVGEAVEDSNLLDPEQLYLATGDQVETDRPIFQGDVFQHVALPVLPSKMPTSPASFEVADSTVMVVPHPCQCYHGDKLRPWLTVAPVTAAADPESFGPDWAGAKDKFALSELPTRDENERWAVHTSVANFGRLISVRGSWLMPKHRVACLSHRGLGLLAKRLAGFQLRHPITIASAMTFTAPEWEESFLMQAWVQRFRSLKGFTAWLHEPTAIPGVGDAGELVAPASVRAFARDELLTLIGALPLPAE